MASYENIAEAFAPTNRRWTAVASIIIDRLVTKDTLCHQPVARELNPEEIAIKSQLEQVPDVIWSLFGAEITNTKIPARSSRTLEAIPARYTSITDPKNVFELRAKAVSEDSMWITEIPVIMNKRGKESLDIHHSPTIARVTHGELRYDWCQSYEETVQSLSVMQQQIKATTLLAKLNILSQAQSQ